MEGPLIIAAIVLAMGGLVTAIIVWSLHVEKKRTEGMREFAGALSLEFFDTAPPEVQSKVNRFQLFNSGRGRAMKNVILGQTDAVSLTLFDYQYTTGTGKNARTYMQTVVAMDSERLQLPEFTMRPEHLFDRIGAAIGLQDIDFEDHPSFSSMFVLKGTDEAAIRNFFDIPLLDFFVERTGICFEAAGEMFIYYRASKRQPPDKMRELLEEGYSVYQAFVERVSR
ncbi:MAG: hypothetical protein H6822_11095 [Planctomycetaceae bacterium]|nr:hypothetical protein [Planctomycetales bacterium]MCB9922720.1 hypothetical protein [Planctomycetaceae bacterium]